MSQQPFAAPDEPYYAPGWHTPRPPTEPLAAASLATAVVGLGPVGVGLGIAALVRVRRRGTRGRGLALAAIAVGAVWTLVALVIAGAAVMLAIGSRALPSDVPHARNAHARQLVPGNCVDPLPADGDIDVVHVVPCAKPHAARVISQYAFEADAVWPGQAAADRRVATACELDAAESAAGLTPLMWAPTAQSWRHGDRTGLCLIHHPAGTPLPSK